MVRIKSELPAFAEDGFNATIAGAAFDVALTANSTSPELPCPGVTTITSMVPEFTKSAAVICACNCVPEAKVVARELPLNWTVDDEAKLAPVTVNVNAAPPAVAETGLNDTMLGVRFAGGGDPPGPAPEPPPHEANNVRGTIQAKVKRRVQWVLKVLQRGPPS